MSSKLIPLGLSLLGALAVLPFAFGPTGPSRPIPGDEPEAGGDSGSTPALETATLGGGCFWCVEAVFQELKGVKRVVSGYAGGHVPNPSYEQICSKLTGHAEVVQITYDPAQVSFSDILAVFWKTHDPTTPNRQGNDVGPQYRSTIMYQTDAQRQQAEALKAQLDASGAFDAPIVTEIVPLDRFYPAEDYHQNYYRTNPRQPYCQYVVAPKVEKFRTVFPDRRKD